MYYIKAPNGNIIAADSDLLSALKLETFETFNVELTTGTLSLTETGNTIVFEKENISEKYEAQTRKLFSPFGELELVMLRVAAEKSEETPLPSVENEEMALFEEPIEFEEGKTEEAEEEPFVLDLLEDEEQKKTSLSIPEEKTEVTDTETEAEEEAHLYDLLIPEEGESEIENIAEETKEEIVAQENKPIYLDVRKLSSEIGIEPEDYNRFLDEYIDNALALEESLRDNDEEKRKEAVSQLIHLTKVLRIPYVENIAEKLEKSDEGERPELVKQLHNVLARLTTSEPTESEENVKSEVQIEVEESQKEKKASIDLSDVKPIHFDFSLEEAAEDLSLPVELIEEFVHDFINQAHEETEKMIAAYERGDLETVQKIGHLLKGTSSNLRITPLAETLYEIQFNEDINRVPELVRNYWAHFLSLENKMNMITNK